MAEFNNIKLNEKNAGEFDYYSVLLLCQKELTSRNSELFKDEEEDRIDVRRARREKINNAITKFVKDSHFSVTDVPDEKQLIHRLFNDLVDFSILTDYINDENEQYEEINVNAWDDVEVRCCNGEVKKIEHFCNIEHAKNVINRLVSVTGSQLDQAMPMAEGNLRNNVRLVVLEDPILDENIGVAASVRLLRPQFFGRQFFIDSGTCSEEEMQFLELAIRSGVSMVFVGETGSGKTTLMNYLLSTLPDNKRIVSIEHNARELSLIRKDENGNTVNNVVHTKTRPHEDTKLNISQEDLVSKALRLDPNVICVGEMRDSEAYAAQEASLTGHTVVTSLHARGISATHTRIAMLAIKKYPINITVALMQAAMAFPVIVYLSKLDDNSRKIVDISECTILEDSATGEMLRVYSELYKFNIRNVSKSNDTIVIDGSHEKVGRMSDSLRETMILHGATVHEVDMIR